MDDLINKINEISNSFQNNLDIKFQSLIFDISFKPNNVLQ